MIDSEEKQLICRREREVVVLYFLSPASINMPADLPSIIYSSQFELPTIRTYLSLLSVRVVRLIAFFFLALHIADSHVATLAVSLCVMAFIEMDAFPGALGPPTAQVAAFTHLLRIEGTIFVAAFDVFPLIKPAYHATLLLE